MSQARKFPIGAELMHRGGVDFRVWAPRAKRVAVEFDPAAGAPREPVPLQAEPNGYFSGICAEARAGLRYRLRLDHGAFPDPASRFQPDGPKGPSEIVDSAFAWTDHEWRGPRQKECVIYELHLGTFTREGTWRAALEQLPELARLGITVIEVMPIAEFPGKFGWGYDGVNLFAPTRLYGVPHDVRAFINRAHELGVAVILDVVYNHLGPDGNYLREFSTDYFSTRYANEWGEPLNFDGENAAPVREFFATNARYWIEEFHFDGLRLDATQQIYDASPTHVLAEIGEAARRGGKGRRVWLVAENETQQAQLVRAHDAGGYALDAIWSDDFHHSAMVAATGRAEAYYSGFRGTAPEFVAAAKHGFLYQGQWYRWQAQRRGMNAFDIPASRFVHFLQNHDQVANSRRGARLHQITSPGRFRALTALLLLSPQLPLLFQGQEFAASAPFLYFADHEPELARRVDAGRRKFLSQFPTIATAESQAVVAEASAVETFRRCQLDLGERDRHAAALQLHADLLRLRRKDATIASASRFDGAVLGEHAFVLRYFSVAGDDRLLVVNLGADLRLEPAPEPLLAPPDTHGWRIRWSSEAVVYGGGGTVPLETKACWNIPGEAAVLLAPDSNRELPDAKLSEKD